MNIAKNILRIIKKGGIVTFLLCIFLFILNTLYGKEYDDFISTQNLQESFQEQVFSLDNLSEVQSTQLYQTPSKDFLDLLESKIDSAQSKVYIEMYIFTEKRTRQALIQAHKRGVDVQVLLEPNPYIATSINKTAYSELKSAGIDVRYSNAYNFSLNHAKLYIIDDSIIFSTGNLSYSSFTKNRDYYVIIYDRELVSEVNRLFESDFNGEYFQPSHPNIVLSPINSRLKLTTMLESAQESVDLYFQYLSDDLLYNILVLLEDRGIEVRLITDRDFIKENPDIIQELRNKGAEVYGYSGSKMHAKGIIVDNQIAYLGSINFSWYSLEKNREFGIIFRDKKIVEQFKNYFNSDISNSQ